MKLWTQRRQSVRTQLVWWNIAALALLLGAFGGVVRYLVGSTILLSVDRELNQRSRPPGEGRPFWGPPPGQGPPRDGEGPLRNGEGPLRNGEGPPRDGEGPPRNGDRPPPEDFPRRNRRQAWAENNPYHPRFFDLSGHSHNPLGQSEPFWDPAAFARAKTGQTVYSIVDVDGQPVRVLSRPFLPHGVVEGVIQVPYPLADVQRALSGLDRALLTLLPVALLCAGLGGALLTDRVLKRVRRLTQAAGGIGAGDLSERLPSSGQDEFSELAETFNGLLGRLETAFAKQQFLIVQQRRFTADASHELKTPLTIIQGNTSLALHGQPGQEEYKRSMQEIGAAAETMSRLVRDLILLAHSDAGRLGRQRIELLLREVLERAVSRVPRPSAPICLTLEDEALSVPGNEEELVRLFTNLLTNAARHTPADSGKITLSARREDTQTVVTVADTGDGIAPEHLPHLGERFYRVDSARSRTDGGTGLGLSICLGIVEAHDGEMTFASVLGEGTTVTVRLPLTG
jgi:signal transduction histidine kinase